jgi:hypothetical protein
MSMSQTARGVSVAPSREILDIVILVNRWAESRRRLPAANM